MVNFKYKRKMDINEYRIEFNLLIHLLKIQTKYLYICFERNLHNQQKIGILK